MNDTTNTTGLLTRLHARLVRQLEADAVLGDFHAALQAAAEIKALADAIAALSPSALDAPVVGDVWMRAIAQAKEESLFADVVSADLHSAGIDTIEDAFMEGRKSVFMEVELEVASRLAASPVAAQAVTDGERVIDEMCRRASLGLSAGSKQLQEWAFRLAHPNAAPCDAQGASNA
jgi:hypothetical protein